MDVRVIAATNRSLQRLVKQGTFREDLYYRLNVVKIDLPPLRDRPEDIPLLAAHFARKYAPPGQPPREVAPQAMDMMLHYRWPGNIRELENAIERACVVSRGPAIEPSDLPTDLHSLSPVSGFVPRIDLSRPLPELIREVTAQLEKRYILKALKKTRGNVMRTARICGLSRRSISEKLRRYRIDKADFKPHIAARRRGVAIAD